MPQRYLLILLALFSFNSPVTAQNEILETKVSIQKEKVSLDEIFNEIEINYNVFFSYTDNILPKDIKLNIDVTDQPLQVLLEEILKGTDIVYFVTETHIILINNADLTDLNSGIHKSKRARIFKHGFRYPSNNSSKFNIELDVVGGISYRKLSPESAEGKNIVSWRKMERVKVGYSVNVLGIYHLNSNLIGGLGIGIVNMGETGKYNFTEVDENCRYRDVVFSNLLSYTNSYTYLTLPIVVGYRHSMNKLSVGAQLELLPSYLLSSGQALEYYDYYEYFYYNSLSSRRQSYRNPPASIQYREWALGYNFQATAMYRLSDKFTYSLGTSYTHYLTSLYKGNAPLKQNSFLLGLTTGIKYSF